VVSAAPPVRRAVHTLAGRARRWRRGFVAARLGVPHPAPHPRLTPYSRH